METESEIAPELRCRICKQIGKGTTTEYEDEEGCSKFQIPETRILFCCECGHEEVLI